MANIQELRELAKTLNDAVEAKATGDENADKTLRQTVDALYRTVLPTQAIILKHRFHVGSSELPLQ